MTKFNEALSESITSLYDYSQNCKVSIELIQRLAQQLKLETFIDKLGYIVEQNVDNKQKTERLSIAGSSILIDIDFVKDNEIVAVSLSSGVTSNEGSVNGGSASQTTNSTNGYLTKRGESNDVGSIEIDTTKSPLQFLSALKGEEKSIAETILLKNLTSDRLNKFPSNLRYLANIDRLTSSTVNVFLLNERIASVLYAINELEGVAEDGDNESSDAKKSVFSSSVGKIKLHNLKTSQLGVFLDFWKDFRYINDEYSKENASDLLIGKEYSALISFEPNEIESEQIDYATDLAHSEWSVATSEGESKKFKFTFKETGLENLSASTYSSSSSSSPNWLIYLNYNHPIYVPLAFLEYLGLSNYKLAQKPEDEISTTYEAFNNRKTIEHKISVSGNEVNLRYLSEIPTKFVVLESIGLNKIVDIPSIIAASKNFLVLSNLLRTLDKTPIIPIKNRNYSHSRRGSKIGKINGDDKELNEETKKRLRDSLKLSCDVTDEELLGLNAISETAAYTTIQPIKKDEIDLDSFLRDEEAEGAKEKPTEQFLEIDFQHLDLSSQTSDILFKIEGRLRTEEISINLKVSNGKIMLNEEADSMEIDSNENIKKVVKVLNVTEDIVKALNVIY